MTDVDVIIISDSKTPKLLQMTRDCIQSLFDSESEVNFNAYVVETQKVDFSAIHPNVIMVPPPVPFGYHKYLNAARSLGSSKFVALCNNDLYFHKHWASNLIEFMDENDILSCSPVSNVRVSGEISYGYRLRKELMGWCIFQKRSIYEIIGDLDEQFIFWYCDDDYAMTLQAHKIKHALVGKSRVDHLVSKTLDTKSQPDRFEITKKQKTIFDKKWEGKSENFSR